MSVRLLVVDDDEIFSERLAAALTRRGFETQVAHHFDEAIHIAASFKPQRAVIDLSMPGHGGLEVLERLRQHLPELRAVICTGYGSIPTTVDAMRLGAVGYVQKPADADMILAAFERSEAPPLRPTEAHYEPPSLAKVEWDHIQRVLSDCGGNISHAARMLGMHRRTLQRKLQQHAPRK